MSMVEAKNEVAQDYKGVLFVGTVVKNDDPDKLQLVKVTIDHVTDDLSIDELPWCIPFVSRLQGMKAGVGTMAVPALGSKLVIEFQKGDPKHPVYYGGLPNKDSSIPELEVNYPHRVGWKSVAGSYFYEDTDTNEIYLHQITGTSIKLDATGKIFIVAVDNTSLTVMGTINITATGNVTVHSDTQIAVTAPTVNVTGIINLN